MKKLITLFLAALSFYVSTAQKSSSAIKKFPIKKIYAQAGLGNCSHSGTFTDISLQAIINNKWSVTLSSHGLSMMPGNVPADYQYGSGTIGSISYRGGISRVSMKLFSLTAGKYFPISNKCWVTTEAGLSIVKGEKAIFKPTAQTSSSYTILSYIPITNNTSNYITSFENKSSLGGMVRADFNWAFLPLMGLGAGVFANLNSIQSPVGFQVKLTLGAMRRFGKAQRRK